MNITIPNLPLLAKHSITEQEFKQFMETGEIQYSINSRASQYCGASLCDRNHLSSQEPPSQRMVREFKAKHGEDPWVVRARLLDRMNNYALEFCNFRKPLGSPNGKNFW